MSLDCRYFLGEKPCRFKRLCGGCEHFQPQGRRILIVKLGAMGDVLRTTPLLSAIKAKHSPSYIYWVTYENAIPLLSNNPSIDKLMPLNLETLIRLQAETFDEVICLDKSADATALAAIVRAEEKIGFAHKENGALGYYNPESAYAYRLGLDDELKFRGNRKSYQQIVFEMLGFEFKGEEYCHSLPADLLKRAEDKLSQLGVRESDYVIGLNTGCGPVFATKKWTVNGFISLAKKLVKLLDTKVLLLGGPDEVERNRDIKNAVPQIIDTGTDNSLLEFAALVAQLDLLLSADTIALHLGIAQKVTMLALFGPTSHTEIDLYGRGEKIIRNLSCAPCYKKHCDQPVSCMESLDAEEVYDKIVDVIRPRSGRR